MQKVGEEGRRFAEKWREAERKRSREMKRRI